MCHKAHKNNIVWYLYKIHCYPIMFDMAGEHYSLGQQSSKASILFLGHSTLTTTPKFCSGGWHFYPGEKDMQNFSISQKCDISQPAKCSNYFPTGVWMLIPGNHMGFVNLGVPNKDMPFTKQNFGFQGHFQGHKVQRSKWHDKYIWPSYCASCADRMVFFH